MESWTWAIRAEIVNCPDEGARELAEAMAADRNLPTGEL